MKELPYTGSGTILYEHNTLVIEESEVHETVKQGYCVEYKMSCQV